MALLLALALSAALVPPREGTEVFRETILGEISHHDRLNGGALAVGWYRAADGDRGRLHVADLKCDPLVGRRTCQFTLIRDGGPVELRGRMVPERLSCSARFRRAPHTYGYVWIIERTMRLPRGSHTGTTLRCDPA